MPETFRPYSTTNVCSDGYSVE